MKAINQHKRMAMGEKDIGFKRGGELYGGEAAPKGGYNKGGKTGYAKGGGVGKGPVKYSKMKMKRGGSVL